MGDLEIIEKIISNSASIPKKTSYSYIARLFPQCADQLLIVKKILTPAYVEQPKEVVNLKEEFFEVTDHDVTGSPLEHSFGEDHFNVTVIGETRNWPRDEENHFPLEVVQASTIMNLCIEAMSNNWTKPVFILTDGSDKEKTILLGAKKEPEWFSTMKVCAVGLKEYGEMQRCSLLMKEHHKLSLVPEREVKVSIFSVYEFCGSPQDTVDWSDNKRIDFEGYLSLQLTWNTLSFFPPIRTSSNFIVAEIAAGWKGSHLRHIWDQLLLLNKYITILENYQGKNPTSRYSVLPLTFPSDFQTPYFKSSETITENLTLLLSGNDNFDNEIDSNKGPFENDSNLDETTLLRSYLKELPSRQNLDFSDQLWHLIRSCNDYAQMTDCIHTVFEEIDKSNYKPHINETDPTRLAKLISDLTSRRPNILSLAGSLPLELVIDMGIEKLSRDYMYLMLSASLADFHEMRKKLPNVSTETFETEKYRKKLMTMAQIHICLEFLLLVQGNLDYSLDTSRSFFNNALKLYTSDDSPVKSFDDLIANTIYTLKVPGTNAVLKEIVKTSPAWWRGTLSSSQAASKFTTTTLYSRIPIFPPNIYSPADSIDGAENYHVTTAVTSSHKIK